ncbi:MAG: TonB-dependent receptor [Sphingomonadaceae bacterium]
MPLVEDRLALRVSADGYEGENFISYTGALAPRDAFIDKDNGNRLRAKLAFRPNGFDDDLSFRLAYEKQHVRRPSGEDSVGLLGDFYEQDDPFSISVFELDNELVSFEANVPLGGGWTAYGIAAYQNSRERGLPIFDNGSSLDVFADAREFSQEARISYSDPGSRLKAVAGIFHFDRDRNEGGRPGSAFVYDADDRGNTIAVFADAVVPFGDFDILAGGRWERERQDRAFLADFGLALDVDIRQSLFLPKGGLRWNIGDNHTVTAFYYRGYSPAAAGVSFLTFTPYQFRRETSDSVELAWRLRRGDVTINANIFGSVYNDEQISGAGLLGPADSIIINADKTRYRGAEAEVKWRAAPWVTLTGAIGLLDAKIVRFGGDPSNDLNNGNRLPNSPEATGRLAAQITPLEELTLDADVRYNGPYFSVYQNTPGSRIAGRVLLDVRASYALGRYTLFAYVENVFDKKYLLSRDELFEFGNAGRPRTFGAAVRARF